MDHSGKGFQIVITQWKSHDKSCSVAAPQFRWLGAALHTDRTHGTIFTAGGANHTSKPRKTARIKRGPNWIARSVKTLMALRTAPEHHSLSYQHYGHSIDPGQQGWGLIYPRIFALTEQLLPSVQRESSADRNWSLHKDCCHWNERTYWRYIQLDTLLNRVQIDAFHRRSI